MQVWSEHDHQNMTPACEYVHSCSCSPEREIHCKAVASPRRSHTYHQIFSFSNLEGRRDVETEETSRDEGELDEES